MSAVYSYLQLKLRFIFLFMFTLLKSGEKVQAFSTILTGRLQHVSADSVITDRYKHASVAIHVSSDPIEILYVNVNHAYD
jgi:hypothetical protein